MDVVGHDDGCIQGELFSVVVETVLENYVASAGRKGLAVSLAERHKQGSSGFLMVRQHAAIVVHPGERDA